MKSAMKLLAKSVLIHLRLTATASAADTGINKKILGSDNSNSTILIISNNDVKKIVEIIESLEDSALLPERARETIQNEAKEQIGGVLSMLLGMLGTRFFGNILASKGINRTGEGVIRAGYGSKKGQKTTTKRQDYEKKKDF